LNVYIVTMTIWRPSARALAKPVFRSLAEAISADIDAGRLGPGDRLPAQRDLARDLGVALPTITRAYGLVREWGLVSGEVGRGTFVRRASPASALAPIPEPEFGREIAGDRINLASNFPAPVQGVESRAVAEAMRRVADRADLGALMRSAPIVGPGRAHSAAARWLERIGLRVGPERIAIGAGPQHAIHALLLMALKPGDTLLTEPTTYPAVIELASALRVRVVPVRSDRMGLDPVALARTLRSTGARAVYCIPTVHPVSGVTMPPTRRRRVAEAVADAGALLIEDEDDAMNIERPPAPIASCIPDHACFVLDSNKCLAPGIRVSFLAIPARYREPFVRAVRATIFAPSPLLTEVASEMISSGEADRLIGLRRAEMTRRAETALRLLPEGSLRVRRGAHHAVLRLRRGLRAGDVVQRCAASGVALYDPAHSTVAPGAPPRSIPIALAGEGSLDRLRRGLELLAGVLAEAGMRR